MLDKLATAMGTEYYEYAGFRYSMVPMPCGTWAVIPADDADRAAHKDKHKRAALKMFLEERK
jgi:hypothetical protein